MFEKITTQAISILWNDISIATICGVRETEQDYIDWYPQINTRVVQAENTDFSNEEATAIVDSVSKYCDTNKSE